MDYDGDNIYLTCGSGGLQIIHVDGKSWPKVVGELEIGEKFSTYVVVRDSLAYLLTTDGLYSDHGLLMIVDVTDPSDPQVVSSTPIGEHPAVLDVQGTLAYSAGPATGLEILDISDPGFPRPVSTLGEYRSIQDLVIDYPMLYMLDSYAGLVIVDVSDPFAPAPVGNFDFEFLCTGLDLVGDVVYVVTTNGIHVLDVRDFSAPELLGSLETFYGLREVAVSGDLAFLAGGENGVQVVDISDSSRPAAVTTLSNIDTSVDVMVSGELVFVVENPEGYLFNGLLAYDMGNFLPQPVLGEFFPAGTEFPCLTVDPPFAYMGMETSLYALDISDPLNPETMDIVRLMGSISDIAESGGYLFLTGTYGYKNPGEVEASEKGYAFSGLQVLDVSDPGNIVLLDNIGPCSYAYAVEARFPFVFVGCDRGFGVVDASDPSDLRIVNTMEIPGRVRDIAIDGPLAVLACLGGGCSILDVSNPESPGLLSSIDLGGKAWEVDLVGRIAYFAILNAGLCILDISDPMNPVILGRHDTSDKAYGVSVNDGFAYVANWESGIDVFDVGDPASPLLVGYHPSGGSVATVDFVDPVLYVTSEWAYDKFSLFLIPSQCTRSIFSVDIISDHSPIYIPAQGGEFSFELSVANNSQIPEYCNLGIEAISEDNEITEIWEKTGVLIKSTGSVHRENLTQVVGGNVDQGKYQYRVWVSDPGGYRIDSDGIVVVKQGDGLKYGNTGKWIVLEGPEGSGRDVVSPVGFSLSAPSPNPFNARTTISFFAERPQRIDLVVFDLAGRKVRSLVEGQMVGAGTNQITWNGLSDVGSPISSGVYFVRLSSDTGASSTCRLVLIK